MEYDGVTKLAEVYANELRLSAQLEARELRKHRRYDLCNIEAAMDNEERFQKITACSTTTRQMGLEAIKSIQNSGNLHQNTMASERLAARRMNEVHKSTNAVAMRALVYASCLALCGVIGRSVCARTRYSQLDDFAMQPNGILNLPSSEYENESMLISLRVIVAK